ncbi:hypothetical protein [Streptomyces sp. NPDC057682]|uniref:hypothetical protein n=1 Tax=Streptomyces sp. NPDC057682 TaxID=3346210 RepID=UPI0036B176EC
MSGGRTRRLRGTAACALLALLAACGGGGGAGPEPDPSPSAAVSLKLEEMTPYDDWLGLMLHLSNGSAARSDVVVRVHIGSGHSGGALPDVEEKSGHGWKGLPLTKDGSGASGTFRMSLPSGGTTAFLGVTPHAGPRVEGDALPLDISVSDGSRTLVRAHGGVHPMALSLDRAQLREPAPLGRGPWTEVRYTATNLSRTAYPQATALAEFRACATGLYGPQSADTCGPGSDNRRVTAELRVQWYDDGRWKDVTPPDDGSLGGDTLTLAVGALPADASRPIRLRFAGARALDGGVRLLTLTARVTGQAPGASARSVGIAPSTTFALR